MPTGGQRAGLGFAIADDAGNDEVGIVERRAVGVGEGIAEFAAFMDGAGRFRGDVAGDAAGEGELLEEPFHARLRPGRCWGRSRCRCLRDKPVATMAGAAVAGADDVNHVKVVGLDDAVEVDVNEIQAGRGAPMPEQTRLDVVDLERLFQQRVVVEINLADGEIIGGAPVGVHFLEEMGRERLIHDVVSKSDCCYCVSTRLALCVSSSSVFMTRMVTGLPSGLDDRGVGFVAGWVEADAHEIEVVADALRMVVSAPTPAVKTRSSIPPNVDAIAARSRLIAVHFDRPGRCADRRFRGRADCACSRT